MTNHLDRRTGLTGSLAGRAAGARGWGGVAMLGLTLLGAPQGLNPALAQSQLGAPARPAAAPVPAAGTAAARPNDGAATRPPAATVAQPGIASPARPGGASAPRPAGTPARPAARPQGGQARPRATTPRTAQPRRPVAPPATPPVATPAPAPEPPAPEPTQGSATGLPLPRFVPLRSDRVNLRVGPDTRFPTEWRYERRDLPVQIIREHEQWRRIRDVDGTEGWVHQSNLTPNRRTYLIRGNAGTEVQMRRRPEAEAPAVARLRPGVIGRLRVCDAGSEWCEIQAGDTRGFVRRAEIFGVLPGEKVE